MYKKIFATLLSGGLMLNVCPAFAEAYPARTVKVVVPWPAGQATDAAARAVSEALTAKLGKPFVIDNRAGAGGAIGSESVARSPDDGYTLLAGSTGAITVNPLLTKASYSAASFTPVGLIATVPYVLVTAPSFPAKDTQALINELRSHPGKYTYASSGNGSIGHLTMELFLANAGIKASHVPYKGSGPALVDVMAGRVDFMFDSVTSILPQLKSDRLRVYAVTSAKRSTAIPDVPTIAEVTELKRFDIYAWIGLMAPAGTRGDVVTLLNKHIQDVVASDEIKRRYLTVGVEPIAGSDPAAMARLLRDEQARISSLVRAANIKVD